jgi:thiol-disulfide isomerase/thioredoxin
MKQKGLFSGVIITLIAIFTACNGGKMSYPLTVEKPFVTYSATNTISIARMELTDTATVLSINATFTPHYWIRIAKECKLVTDKGVELSLVSSEGIEPDSLFWMPDSGKASFTLTFEPMPVDTKYFDFIECSGERCFNIYGIYFSPKKPIIKIPSEWKNIRYNDKDILPESFFSKDSAVVSGFIPDYRPMMNIPIQLYYTPFGEDSKDVSIAIDDNGCFRIAAAPYYPINAFLIIQNHPYPIILVPGKESSVLINLSELSDPSYAPEYKGYLASTQHDLAVTKMKSSDFNAIIEDDEIEGKPADFIISYLDGKLKELFGTIDTLKIGQACKQLYRIKAEVQYLDIRLAFEDYLVNQKLQKIQINTQEDLSKFLSNYNIHPASFIDSLRTDIPALDCVNGSYFSLTDNIFTLYSRYTEIFPKIETTDNEEAMKAYAIVSKFNNGTELSDTENKELDSFKEKSFKELILEKKADREAQMKALKENKSVHINELDQIAPDKTLDTIIERYKGKAVLVDVWATWCGPCRAAHKSMLPLKDEMKNQDVVFVYLTGPTSPIDKWSEMIPEISGEHYYLTNEQYSSIFTKYESNGVPTYLIFDKTGKFAYKSIGFPGNDTMKAELKKAMN